MTAPCPTFCFRVTMELPTAGTSAPATLQGDWMVFLESRGLRCTGGGSVRLEYLVSSEASQATENDRVAARAWLASRPELRGWLVGELEDLDQAA